MAAWRRWESGKVINFGATRGGLRKLPRASETLRRRSRARRRAACAVAGARRADQGRLQAAEGPFFVCFNRLRDSSRRTCDSAAPTAGAWAAVEGGDVSRKAAAPPHVLSAGRGGLRRPARASKLPIRASGARGSAQERPGAPRAHGARSQGGQGAVRKLLEALGSFWHVRPARHGHGEVVHCYAARWEELRSAARGVRRGEEE